MLSTYFTLLQYILVCIRLDYTWYVMVPRECESKYSIKNAC